MPNFFKNNRNANFSPFHFSDPQLVPRVRQYIDENRNRQHVDITMMADNLQRRYPRDYARRKRIAFRGMVAKVYAHLLQQSSAPFNNHFNQDGNTNNNQGNNDSFNDSSNNDKSKAEEDFTNDDDVIVDPPEKSSNVVNKQLMNLYASSPSTKNNHNDSGTNNQSFNNDQELINLSSDDESNADKNEVQKPAPKALKALEEDVKIASPAPSEQPVISEVVPSRGQKRKAAEVINPSSVGPPFRKKKREIQLTVPTVTLKDIGGNRKTIEEVIKLLIHLKHPEVYATIGVTLPRGFLLHGPPGCGKTLLAHAIAGELELPFLKVAGPELVAGVSGESEERIRDLFEQAVSLAPCILFIDEIDVISSRRESAHRNMEQRIVAQLLCSLDNLDNVEKGNQVLVIGATNRQDSMDPALRRAGRFDREICLGIPDQKSRLQILQILVANMKLSTDVSLEWLAELTPGYVGADLKSLAREAAIAAVSRICEDIKIKRLKKESAAQKEEDHNCEDNDEAVSIVEDISQDITILRESDNKSKNNKDENEKNMDCDIVEIESNKSGKNSPIIVLDVVSDVESTSLNKNEKLSDDSLKESSSSLASNGKDPENCPVMDVEEPMDIEETDSATKNKAIKENNVKKLSENQCSFLNPKDSVEESIESLLAWLRDKTPLSETELSELYISKTDFEKALKTIQPSSKREGFVTVPDVTWNDIGSLRDIRQELQMAILAPVRHSELFTRLGLTAPTGILLCGPPGCGKTLLAKAVANEAGINFISVKGPELLNMYVGESERAVRQCFERARNSQPCVIFFDELDALCPKRSESRDSGGSMRVVNQLLTEMDGVEGRFGVFLMAATNRPDIVDPAVMRPGRLDKILYVGLPSPSDRADILKALTKNGTCPALDTDVDLSEIGSSDDCSGYTGADLAALIREAGVQALKEYLDKPSFELRSIECISLRHLKNAIKKIRPSVSEKDQKHYEKLKLLYSAVTNTSNSLHSASDLKEKSSDS